VGGEHRRNEPHHTIVAGRVNRSCPLSGEVAIDLPASSAILGTLSFSNPSPPSRPGASAHGGAQ
jgi:hypothetical protein